ncbi:MAG: hypothetical protein HYX87_00090 [Chloroflexi bacterium]|nr:hypothetical protein [Chloroflexota bacterium]
MAHTQETIVSFIDGEDSANIFTCSRRWQRHLAKLGINPNQGKGGHDYVVPKSWIKLPGPPARRSQTQRDAARRNAQALHKTGHLAVLNMAATQGSGTEIPADA